MSSPSSEKQQRPSDDTATVDNNEAASIRSSSKSSRGELGPSAAQEPYKVSKGRFALIFGSLMLCIFLFALDQLIVATAIPKITDDFNSLTQLPWIANGFFMTLLSFNLAFAQWTAIFPAKHVTLFAVGVFELGSLLCGVAPSMNILILGRVIAGAGGAGIFNGALMILTEITTMQERAKVFGLLGVNFAVASVTGPLIGGAFADHLTWRWCFYINLPIGGIAFFLIAFLVDSNPPFGRAATYQGYGKTMLWQLLKCDWVGVAFMLGWSTVSVLAMQQGGVTLPWSNGSVIAEYVMIPVLFALFVVWEIYMGEQAMLPMLLFRRPIIVAAATIAIFTQGPFMFLVYYLSEAYQAVYNTSATNSGIQLLPLIIVNVVVLIAAGRIVARFGRPQPIMILGAVLLTIGSGLLYSVKVTDSKSKPMGYSAIIGFGVGLVLQNTIVLAQYEFHKEPKYVAIGTGAVTFAGFIGRLFGIGIAGSVFGNMIKQNMHKYAPELSEGLLQDVTNNANAVWDDVPEALRAGVLQAYVKTLGSVYLIGVPAGIIALVAAISIGPIKMDLHAQKKPKDVESAADTASTSGDAVSTSGDAPSTIAHEEKEGVEEKV